MLKTPLPHLPHLKVLGDTHLGRRFINDVPLHRRGDRERLVREHFVRALTEGVTHEDLVVQTGDIFDSFMVDADTVLFAWQALRDAQQQTRAEYVVYRGNHDGSRDAAKKSAFDLFQGLCSQHLGISVLSEPTVMYHDGFNIGFMPWHPFKSAEELARDFLGWDITTNEGYSKIGEMNKMATVFTHCDMESFGENTHNVMPYQLLSEVSKSVLNGHVHSPTLLEYKDTPFICVGSMEPYTHGEDPDEKMYITRTLEDYSLMDHDSLQNKYVRILLGPNESLPDTIPNCLGFTSKRVKDKDDKIVEEDDSEVIIEDFSMDSIVKRSLEMFGVSGKVSDKILARFAESKNVT